MTIALDLPTILFVLQASYLAGAMALGYARYRSPDAAGAEIIAVGFLVLALGALMASNAEFGNPLYAARSLANVSLGTLAYALFLAGAMELSRRRPIRPLWIVLLPPLVTVAAGILTGFHTINWLRAMVFNGTSAVAMLTAAWVFYRDGRTEPLAGRRIVALAFAATGADSLMMATEFATGTFWPPLALCFVLLLALKFAIALSVIILTMERTMAKLDRLAHTDALTGLGNRRCFFEAVPANLQAGDAIVVFDADRFKKLNDTWGHAVGDDALQAIARALAAHLRDGDVLARHGGEEFILFLPATGEAGALAIADTMRAAVDAATIADVRATISAGIAISPASGTSLEHLIRAADAALYDAKAAGRNTCRVSRGGEPGEADASPTI
ncbi:diguanylate cyclase domain-containing protein [Pleomorphomonas sp. PLEO]|uniref:GGDEF domain-containing protein n=1 Tax=Pleomorphomonas sp. PLEO TaxID=3239306 RepID=UPI00351F6EC7